MNTIVKTAAIASMMAMAAVTYSTTSYAQSNDQIRKCIGDACPGQGMDNGQMMQNQNDQPNSNDQLRKLRRKGAQSNDQYQDNNSTDQVRKLRKKGVQSSDQYQDYNDNGQMGSQRKMRHADWKYEIGRAHV